jgi:putative transposase
MVTAMGAPQQVGPLSILSEWAVSMHAFRRNKVPVLKKVVAAALCNSGYSYRDVAAMVGGISYVAARDAYFSLTTSLPRDVRKFRRSVAIDGSDLAIGGRPFHVWLARDVESGEIMSFQASPDASADDGARFLASVASQCTNRPALKLGVGPNHPRGLVNFDLYFQSAPSQSIITRLGRLLLGNGVWDGV